MGLQRGNVACSNLIGMFAWCSNVDVDDDDDVTMMYILSFSCLVHLQHVSIYAGLMD